MKRKEYKKVYRQIHIDNEPHFSDNLGRLLRNIDGGKIEHIITHKPYHITIIYSKLEEVN